MEVGHETSRLSYKVDDVVGQKVGLNRRNAVAFDAFDAVEFANEVEEIVVAAFAEVADVDACDDYFLAAFVGSRASLIDNFGYAA